MSFSVTLGIAVARSKVVVEPSPVKESFFANLDDLKSSSLSLRHPVI